jgi:hypothetical protein
MTDSGVVATAWRPIYRVAGWCAACTAVLIPVQVAVFLAWPPPLDGTAVDWFSLLRSHRLAGLVDLDLLLVVDNVLLIPLLLALYLVLRPTHPAAVLLATAAGLTSVVLYVATNPALAVAALADRHTSATTEAARTGAVAAADAALATWQGTAFHTAYLLGSAAGIAFGVVMLRTTVFTRATGWLAIAANTVGLGLYLPGIGVYISVFSVLFLEIWYLLLAHRLLASRDAGLWRIWLAAAHR